MIDKTSHYGDIRPPRDAAERKRKAANKAAERQRKKEAGLVQKELWTKPELWPKIVDFVKKLHGDGV